MNKDDVGWAQREKAIRSSLYGTHSADEINEIVAETKRQFYPEYAEPAALGLTETELDEPAPTTATKAWVGSGIAIVLAFLASLITALSDNVVSPVEWLIATVAALTVAGSVFTGVYWTANKPTP